MTKFQSKYIPLILLAIGSLNAQNQNATVRITVPNGTEYFLDGQGFFGSTAAVFPLGSKHTLSVAAAAQTGVASQAQYTFVDWEWSGGVLPGGNTVTFTAGPPFTEIKGVFAVAYQLTLSFFSCPDPTQCHSAGTIYVNGTPYVSNQNLYFSAGSSVQLMATPNPGYVFAGWSPGLNQSIQGSLDTVTMNGPTVVYPMFNGTRTVNLITVPAGLQLYADRQIVTSPAGMEWGWDTTHTVGPVSPQRDSTGNWWAFSSWSDGGDVTHGYKVTQSPMPDSLTATFVPASVTDLHTSPGGLTLIVDGRSNWMNYDFVWGVGETHHLEAPARQMDSNNRLWAFDSWSNGGARAQDFVVPPIDPVNGSHLTANYNPLGHLMVTSPMTGLVVNVDGALCPTPCDVTRPVGTTVQVSAPASIPLGDNTRGDFDGWAGSGSFATVWSVTLGPDLVALNATYHTMNRLIVASTPPQGAAWQMDPPSMDGFYNALTTVTVTATAQPGFRFRNFSGDLSGVGPAGTVQMNTPRAVMAVLDRVPYIAPTGVSNAAGSTPQAAVAPGSIASIFGASLGDSLATGPLSPMMQALGGVTVKAGGRLLPLFFVSPTQVNVQLPADLTPGNAMITVSCDGMPDVQAPFSMARNAPGLFQQVVNTQNFAVAVHEDGSPVSADSPAMVGELLTVYGTGFGPTDHPRPEGLAVPTTPVFNIVDTVSVQAGNAAIPADSAIAAAGQVGLDAVRFRLTDSTLSGTNVAVYLTVNGQNSNTVLLPVQ